QQKRLSRATGILKCSRCIISIRWMRHRVRRFYSALKPLAAEILILPNNPCAFVTAILDRVRLARLVLRHFAVDLLSETIALFLLAKANASSFLTMRVTAIYSRAAQ